MIFISCSEDEKLKHDVQSSNNYVQKSARNVFNEIINNNEELSIQKFTHLLNDLKFQSIDIINVNKNLSKLDFRIESPSIIINGDNQLLLNESVFTLSKNQDNDYILSNNQTNFSILFDTNDSTKYLMINNHVIKFDDLTDETINKNHLYLNYPIYSEILNQFVLVNDLESNDLYHPTPVPNDYEGTGFGYHKTRTNAQHFCALGFNEILDSNPGWCSPGTSISCL